MVSLWRAWVQFLVVEIRSHKLRGASLPPLESFQERNKAQCVTANVAEMSGMKVSEDEENKVRKCLTENNIWAIQICSFGK